MYSYSVLYLEYHHSWGKVDIWEAPCPPSNQPTGVHILQYHLESKQQLWRSKFGNSSDYSVIGSDTPCLYTPGRSLDTSIHSSFTASFSYNFHWHRQTTIWCSYSLWTYIFSSSDKLCTKNIRFFYIHFTSSNSPCKEEVDRWLSKNVLPYFGRVKGCEAANKFFTAYVLFKVQI